MTTDEVRIRIGNQSAYSAAALSDPFEYGIQSNFDAFEWFPDKQASGAGWDVSEIGEETRRYIRDAARDHDIRLSVHAPWRANPFQPEGYDTLLADLGFAEEIGAGVLNIHLYTELGTDAYIRALLPLVERAAQAGIRLSIENTPLTSPQNFNELFARLRDLGVSKERVGMCLDLGHANLCGPTRNDYLKFMDLLAPRVPIIHIHLHENYGDYDSHMTIFTGPAARDSAGVQGFVKRIKDRGFSGCIILEQWPQPPSLLNQARERLKAMLGEDSGGGETVRNAPEGHNVHSSRVIDDRRPRQGRDVQRFAPDEALISGATEDYKHYVPTGPDRETFPPEDGVHRPADMSTPFRWQPAEEVRRSPRAQGTLLDETERDAKEREFLDRLIGEDRRRRSWREKLDLVRGVLADETLQLSNAELTDLAIYLRFLGTGEIACAEDGRHYRPSHHSRTAIQIQERLRRLASPDNAYVIRKIYPWLPSTDTAFTRSEPLTRIRDIAHRNDIPRELKQEIKHKLQNKLHRCAGPEDLATSAEILKRVSASGYSRAFVEQFKVFHEELKEFFNARSLEERLDALLRNPDVAAKQRIREFLKEKAEQGMCRPVAAFRCLTALRRSLLSQLEEASGSLGQELLLADIGLEDFAFVLLSRMINFFTTDQVGVPGALSLEFLLLTLSNLSLSEIFPEECRAIESELNAWSKGFIASDADGLHRLKATLDRCRRVAEDHCNRVVETFSVRAERLGRALGVPEHSVRVFSEGEVRGHLVFQLAKLVSALMRSIRSSLGLQPWDVLVSGRVVGRAILADTLDELRDYLEQPVIALMSDVNGDEEIPAGLMALVLAHDVPHLSHLAVRARQRNVLLVSCANEGSFEQARLLAGKIALLDASSEKVRFEAASEPPDVGLDGTGLDPAELPTVILKPGSRVIPLEQVLLENGGSKAASARRLKELSLDGASVFHTPPGLLVPFGVMEEALRAAPELEREYLRLMARMNQVPSSELDPMTALLRELIGRLPVDEEIAEAVVRHFSNGAPVIVRSSANCEDLPALASAGLYDSVPNVPPSEAHSAVRAVWASLWTGRAARSRKQAGIPHEKAHMAVLIQEMLRPDLSFIMHTVNPRDRNADEVYVELAVGLGPTLASGAAPGSPYQMVCNKGSAKVKMLGFASFSYALRPGSPKELRQETIDYSIVAFSQDATVRQNFGSRLASIAREVESAFGCPQDVEGAILGDEIYLVQSRPQA